MCSDVACTGKVWHTTSLIRSFHEDMMVQPRVQGKVVEGEVIVINGYGKAAPWLQHCFFKSGHGRVETNNRWVTLLYRNDGQLIGS